MSLSRSSRSYMIFKIGFLKNFAIVTGKHLYLLKETPNRCFHLNIANVLRKSLFIEHLRQLLLLVVTFELIQHKTHKSLMFLRKSVILKFLDTFDSRENIWLSDLDSPFKLYSPQRKHLH